LRLPKQVALAVDGHEEEVGECRIAGSHGRGEEIAVETNLGARFRDWDSVLGFRV